MLRTFMDYRSCQRGKRETRKQRLNAVATNLREHFPKVSQFKVVDMFGLRRRGKKGCKSCDKSPDISCRHQPTTSLAFHLTLIYVTRPPFGRRNPSGALKTNPFEVLEVEIWITSTAQRGKCQAQGGSTILQQKSVTTVSSLLRWMCQPQNTK